MLLPPDLYEPSVSVIDEILVKRGIDKINKQYNVGGTLGCILWDLDVLVMKYNRN